MQHFFYSTGFGVALGATLSTPRELSVQYRKIVHFHLQTKECLPRAIILFSICILGNKIWKNISNYSFVHNFLALNKLHCMEKNLKNFLKSTFSGRLVARQPPRIMAGSYKNLRVMHTS